MSDAFLEDSLGNPHRALALARVGAWVRGNAGLREGKLWYELIKRQAATPRVMHFPVKPKAVSLDGREMAFDGVIG